MKNYASTDGKRAIQVSDDMMSIEKSYGLSNVLCCDPESLIETEELIETTKEFKWTEGITSTKYYVANHETGDVIEDVSSIEEGEELIRQYEEEDKADGTYERDFYTVMEKDLHYIKNHYGMSIKQISDRFGIPYRTVQNWSDGNRQCADYIIAMMDEILQK